MKLENNIVLNAEQEIVIKTPGNNIILSHEMSSAIWAIEEKRETVAMLVKEKLLPEEIECIDIDELAELYNDRKYEFVENNSNMLIEQALRDQEDNHEE